MKLEYRKALNRQFADSIHRHLPQFALVRVHSDYFWPGDTAYEWRISGNTSIWINLTPDRVGQQRFDIEIGWSRFGRWPELGVMPSMERPTCEHEEFSNDEYLTRLAWLWSDDHCWSMEASFYDDEFCDRCMYCPIVADDIDSGVTQLVDNAIEHLMTEGWPYLQAFACECEQANPPVSR